MTLTYKVFAAMGITLLFATGSFAALASAAGNGRGGEHQSAIASTTKRLKDAASTTKGIGDEISDIAKEIEENAAKEGRAIEAVEGRGALKTLLLGSDMKNLGVLRSTLVTSQNHLDRLTRSLDKATGTPAYAEIRAEIEKLAALRASVEKFVQEHKVVLGVRGWVAKLLGQ